MQQSAVFIATTEQPVRVLRLVKAPHQRQSVACIGLRARKATISDRYHDFVSHECGVIARATGCEKYRLDLARDIEAGESWQLGTLIAHSLADVDTLASTTADAADDLPDGGALVWATGEVDADLNVHPVADIERKLAVSRPLFEKAGAAGVPVRAYVPAGNDSEAVREWLAACAEGRPDFTWHFVDRAPRDASAWAVAHGASRAAGAGEPRAEPAPTGAWLTRARTGRATLALAAAVVVAVVLLLGRGVNPTQAARNGPAIAGTVSVTVASDGRCFGERSVHDGGPIQLSWNAPNRIVMDEPVCVLDFVFRNTSSADVTVVSEAGSPRESLSAVAISAGETGSMRVAPYLHGDNPPTDITLRATWPDGGARETSVVMASSR